MRPIMARHLILLAWQTLHRESRRHPDSSAYSDILIQHVPPPFAFRHWAIAAVSAADLEGNPHADPQLCSAEAEVGLEAANALCLGFVSYCRISFLHSLFQLGIAWVAAGTEERTRDSRIPAPSITCVMPGRVKFRSNFIGDTPLHEQPIEPFHSGCHDPTGAITLPAGGYCFVAGKCTLPRAAGSSSSLP